MAHARTSIGNDKTSTERRLLFLSGLLAGLVTAACMLALREVSETDSLIELIGEALLQAMPTDLFSFMLRTFQEAAKPLLVASIVAGLMLVGGGAAQLDGGPARVLTPGRRWARATWLVLGIWVPVAIFAVIVTTYGNTVPLSNSGLLSLAVIQLLDTVIFVAATYLLYPLLRAAFGTQSTRVDVDAPPASLSRRRLIAGAGVGALGLVSTAYVGRFVSGIRGGAIGGGRVGIPEPVTSNGDFYLISKNFVDPKVGEDSWRLEVNGLVETPLELAYIDLLEMPRVEQQTTLTCISNEVGGDLISNASWTGVRLADILARAGVRPEVSEVALYADDGYSESLPLSKAVEETTLLVYLMNGEPLPSKHGFPARLIVPGKYGIKNVKWLTRVQLLAADFEGYWQQRGWTDEATIRTMSRFDIPSSRSIVSRGPIELGGIAFAGDRGVSRVEISVDGGDTWSEASQLQQIAPLSWVIWRSTWNPPGSGTFRLKVRATDGTGAVQEERKRKPIPTGASGYHSIEIGVT